MMTSQDIIALLLVSLAMLFLLHRAWRLFVRRSAGCGACASCPAPAAGQPGVVSITPLRQTTAGPASPAEGGTN